MIVYLLEDNHHRTADRSIRAAAEILMDLKINMEQFRENVMGLLVSQRKMSMFTDLRYNVKHKFYKMFNELNK